MGEEIQEKTERGGIVAFKHEELELSEEHLSDSSHWKENWVWSLYLRVDIWVVNVIMGEEKSEN